MNDSNQRANQARRYSGRTLLILGVMVALAGPAIYTLQTLSKSLMAPWYVPILATLGVLLIAWSLIQCRTIWRWGAVQGNRVSINPYRQTHYLR
jgi:hypothetical protein